MTSLPTTEMPKAGISTEPTCVQVLGDVSGVFKPRSVDVLGFLQVDVQKMVGRGQAGFNPAMHVFVESPLHIGSHLKEMDEVRVGLLGVDGVEIEGAGAPVEFTGDPNSQAREGGEAFLKGCHHGDHAQTLL